MIRFLCISNAIVFFSVNQNLSSSFSLYLILFIFCCCKPSALKYLQLNKTSTPLDLIKRAANEVLDAMETVVQKHFQAGFFF